MAMPTTRRVVTGLDANGKSTIIDDKVLTPANPLDPEGNPPSGVIPGFTNIAITDGIPAKPQSPFVDYHGKKVGLVDQSGVFCRIVDFPAVGEAPDDVNFMHLTHSVDFGVVLKGSIKLVLDNGDETVMNEGDVCVQRATNHAWKNVSKENCRMLFVLVPSEPPRNESTGEVLQPTDTAHLKE